MAKLVIEIGVGLALGVRNVALFVARYGMNSMLHATSADGVKSSW